MAASLNAEMAFLAKFLVYYDVPLQSSCLPMIMLFSFHLYCERFLWSVKAFALFLIQLSCSRGNQVRTALPEGRLFAHLKKDVKIKYF